MDRQQIIISSANCKFSISFNDFEILNEKEGLRLDTEFPLSHLLVVKNNLLSLSLQPAAGQSNLTDIVQFHCAVVRIPRGSEEKETLLEWEFNQGNQKLPSLKWSKAVVTKEENEQWPKLKKIELTAALIEQVTQQYQRFWKALKAKDLNEISSMVIHREKIYAEALGISLSERMQMVLAIYENHIADAEFYLYDFMPQFFKPKLQMFGKVLSLQDSKDFNPIFFLSKDEKQTINIPLHFGIINEKLEVII